MRTWHWTFRGKPLDWFEWRKALNEAAPEGAPLAVDVATHRRWLGTSLTLVHNEPVPS